VPVSNDRVIRTTITFPRSWERPLREAVQHLRSTTDPGARPNDIYREALRQYLVRKGFLKDGDQA